MSPRQDPTDADLMRQVADGSEPAFAALYGRFARPILGLAVQSLDRATAEDIVQDVFLTIWRHADTFDPERGTVRAWILQIAHHRVLNELRRRSRKPAGDGDGRLLGEIEGRDPGPAERTIEKHRREVLGAALEELPRAQREALDLAFFDDLTHEQVATRLDVPLGTAKTRIRAGLQKLRASVVPRFGTFAALTLLIALGLHSWTLERTRARDDRALTMLTASDSVNLRLAPTVPVVPAATHARYRGRPGSETAVVTLSNFPPPTTGETYQIRVRHADRWTSLGTVRPDASGSARLIAESPALTALPDEVVVTAERTPGGSAPSERVVVGWTRE